MNFGHPRERNITKPMRNVVRGMKQGIEQCNVRQDEKGRLDSNTYYYFSENTGSGSILARKGAGRLRVRTEASFSL